MKIKWILWVTFVLFALNGSVLAKGKSSLKNTKDKVSYSIGMSIGKNFQQQKLDLNLNVLMKGIKDVLDNKKPQMTDEEVRNTMNDFRKEMMAKFEKEKKALEGKNAKEGAKFLAKNKKEKGVTTLKSGLQYKVMKKGNGPKPTLKDVVVTNYKGTLLDGTEFDSSYKRGQPATFPVQGVIKGWQEALQLMPKGSKWKLFVPSVMAYGDKGNGRVIGPNATLVFEIELLDIKPKS
ncbi:MAG: FKBP-type peptidyl-prolyl cis-trans isomerase [Deltaproteobacteria bacterium]|nr:FKBP-type peptidyl-prolyl cis-trans isomerase [Deltaproteobacteria bacterium]